MARFEDVGETFTNTLEIDDAGDGVSVQVRTETTSGFGPQISSAASVHIAKSAVRAFAQDAAEVADRYDDSVTVTLPRKALEMLLIDLEVAGLPSLTTGDFTDAAIEILKNARNARKGA